MVGLGVVVGGIEATLRLLPGLFTGDALSWAFSRYDTLPGGMYVKERRTKMRFMRADFSTRAYSHGYFWRHRTDRLGFRNPSDLVDHDVLLLGDSFIYGHGVEETDTVAHFLRAEHQVAAYNMASQGQCLYEHTVLLNLYLDQLRPQTVVLFAFLNDFQDLEKKRPKRLIQKIPEIHSFDYDEIRVRVDELRSRTEPWPVRAAFELGTVRLATKWIHKAGGSEAEAPVTSPKPDRKKEPAVKPLTRRAQDSDAGPYSPQNGRRPVENTAPMNAEELRARGLWPGRVEVPILDPARFAPIARYYRRVVAHLGDRCRRREIRPVLVQLSAPSGERGEVHAQAQRKLRRFLAKIADEHDIEFFDTEDLFKNSESNFLPEDGHFSAVGHRRLARFIAEDVGLNGGKLQVHFEE